LKPEIQGVRLKGPRIYVGP